MSNIDGLIFREPTRRENKLQAELNRTKGSLLRCHENAEPAKLLIQLQKKMIEQLNVNGKYLLGRLTDSQAGIKELKEDYALHLTESIQTEIKCGDRQAEVERLKVAEKALAAGMLAMNEVPNNTSGCPSTMAILRISEMKAEIERLKEEYAAAEKQWETAWFHAADYELIRTLMDGKEIAPAAGSVAAAVQKEIEKLNGAHS